VAVEHQEEERFPLGVNYWPRRKAMYWWSDFDRSEVGDEFDVIAGLGMSVVRIFLLWDDWQPTPMTVSDDCLGNLGSVLDLAAERGLGLDVTFFTGHMSGPNWSPGWLLDGGSAGHPSPSVRQVVSGGRVVDRVYRNMFHDPVALDAERLLLETVVGEYRDHPGIWMWNLGNEPDLFAWPRDAQAGRGWVREMTTLIEEIDTVHPVTIGLHTANLFRDTGLRVNDVFEETDVAVIHGYPMYVDWARGPLDPDFVPFLCALVSALSGKPCLAEEWGGCTSPGTEGSVTWDWTSYGQGRTQFMAGEESFAGYVAKVLPGLVDVGSTGALMWCFADYAPELWDRPPCDDGGARHERHFGLVRPDGSLKPHAAVLQRFAATNPTIRPAIRTIDLDVAPERYYESPETHARRLYRGFTSQPS
jgi:endo-1,4-beta-mannosidase